jgi:hypothetical protein
MNTAQISADRMEPSMQESTKTIQIIATRAVTESAVFSLTVSEGTDLDAIDGAAREYIAAGHGAFERDDNWYYSDDLEIDWDEPAREALDSGAPS